MTEPWQLAFGLGAGFVVTHHVLSHPPVRSALIARTGNAAFVAIYSLVAALFYAPLAWLWWTTTRSTPVWWALRGSVPTAVASALIVTGFVLAVAAMVRPAPTSMAMRGRTPGRVSGMSAFTRHPLFWGLTLLSLGHLIVDGGAVDVAFHATNVFVGVFGAYHQDHRFLVTVPEYADYRARTRMIPLPWPVPGATVGLPAMAGGAVGFGLALLARATLH